MELTTLIKDLTETQILGAIREMFEGRHVTGIKLEPLINGAKTLGDLHRAITKALLDLEDADHLGSRDNLAKTEVNHFSLPENYCRESPAEKELFTKSLMFPTRFHGQNFNTADNLYQYLEHYCATREDKSQLT